MSFWDRLGQKLSRLVDDIAVPDAVREDLVRGKAALESGELDKAEGHLERATGTAPDHPRGWHLLGLTRLRQDRPDEAVANLRRALDLEGDDFSLLLALAEAQRAACDLDAAIKSYKQALTCRADEQLLDRAYGGLGEIYLERGQVHRAIRELRKAVAVSQGRDLRLVGLLGLAQLGDRHLALARESLSRAAAAVPPDRAVLLGLARALLELGEPQEASLAATRLLQESSNDVDARCLLARGLLDLGQAQAAHQELLRALERAPTSFEAHRLLAQVHIKINDLPTAIRHLEAALSLEIPAPGVGTDPQIPVPPAGTDPRRQLVSLRLELGTDPGPLKADASVLLEQDPDDPLGLAGLAVARCHVAPDEASQLVRRALATQETYEGRLAEGQVHLAQGQLDLAATALRAAVRVSPGPGARARALLDEAYEQLAGGPLQGPATFYTVLRRLRQLLGAQPELGVLATDVAHIQEIFDRPLLVVVMGEFNSGKSTFVNALIGEEVAPMGVTPTTATINILKYGEQRGARVVWRDDREERMEWDQIGRYLRELGRAEARAIRFVELLYPSEELLRVNIVDTPGLNSMVDEHEATAREHMTLADAVIWLFSAGQAGKQTEQQALELLHEHRLKTVGVLNKVDRLDQAELEQVLGHLRREFADLVEEVVPVAARPALDAMRRSVPEGDSAERLAASRFPDLRQFLEQRIFARSRRIKREVCERRLDDVLGAVTDRTGAVLEAADRAVERIDGACKDLRQRRADQAWLEREQAQVHDALQSLYRDGASEVLDFVRPRRWAFGEHRATAADRDYLQGLLMEGLVRVGEASAARIGQRMQTLSHELTQLQSLFAAPTMSPLGARVEAVAGMVDTRLGVMGQQVYGRYQAFVRGYLQGGRVDTFFEQRLPHLELEHAAIQRALFADSVDVEQELLQPLAVWHRETLDDLERQLTRLRTDVDLTRLEQDRRVLGPISILRRALRSARTDPLDRPGSAGTDPLDRPGSAGTDPLDRP